MAAAAIAALALAASPVQAESISLPLGDGHISTTTPKVGWVYACSTNTGGNGGAAGSSPWITGSTWDPALKPSVQGAKIWLTAKLSIKTTTTKRVITTTGLPVGSATGTFPISVSDPVHKYDANPNTINGNTVTISVARYPQAASKPQCLTMGAIGYTTNGVAVFNALDAELRDAAAHEVLDACDGHPERTGQYHYHSGSRCLLAKAKGSSTLIGYALDGYGIYVEKSANGALLTNANLDVCHGRTSTIAFNGKSQKMYHYVVTAAYPYTLGCYHGTPVSTGQPSGPSAGTGAGPGMPPPAKP